mgnify:CR=1 FL=1
MPPGMRSTRFPSMTKYFPTKTSIMHDLERCGVSNAEYLPFAYCPEDHRPVAPTAERQCDVLYVGGADADRRTLFAPIVADREIRGCFCGGYWDAYPEFRPFAGGHLDAAAYRTAVASAKINVVNGRKANRDQHAMRSFEIPAMGGCMILEDTSEHRRLFGEEGECALYYSTPEELHEKVRRLLKDENLRQRLATAAHRKIMDGGHSYADRLVTMGRELGILN